MNAIKLSISLPHDQAKFVERERTATGTRGTSHVIQDAVALLMKSRRRAAKYLATRPTKRAAKATRKATKGARK